MPFKKRYSKRPSKPSVRKAKRMVAKIHKRKAKKNMDTFFLKARTVGVTTPQQGITVANYLSSFCKLLDPTSIVGVTQNAEFNLFKNLYDKVRINSISVRFTPKANVNTAFDNVDQIVKNNKGDGMIHTVILRDDEGFQQNIPRLSRTPSYKSYSVLKPWKRTYSVKYPQGVWLDCQNIYSDTTLLDRLGLTGGIGWYAENLIELSGDITNAPVGAVEITYNCVFQGKIMGSLTFNSDESVVVAKPVALSYTPTPIDGVQGSIADSRYDMYNMVVPVTDADTP